MDERLLVPTPTEGHPVTTECHAYTSEPCRHRGQCHVLSTLISSLLNPSWIHLGDGAVLIGPRGFPVLGNFLVPSNGSLAKGLGVEMTD